MNSGPPWSGIWIASERNVPGGAVGVAGDGERCETLMTRLTYFIPILLILAFTLAFNVQISSARTSATMVPHAISVLIVIFSLMVIFGTWRSNAGDSIKWTDTRFIKTLALLGLSLGYCAVFILIDFHIANLLFVLAAALLMRLSIGNAVALAVATAIVVFGLSSLMDFNLPDPIWRR